MGRTQTAASERRSAPRLGPAYGTTCRFDRDVSPAAPPHGLVWNLSRSGAGMMVAGEPALGTVLSGELATDAGDRLAVLLRVARVQPVATGDVLLGCRFLRELTDAELAPFVDPDADPHGW